MDLDGDIIAHQRIYYTLEPERNKHCPLKEIKE